MNHTRKVSALALALVLATATAACGSDDDNSADRRPRRDNSSRHGHHRCFE